MAVRTRCGELLLLLLGRKEDRSGRPKERVVIFVPLLWGGRVRLGRAVLIVRVGVCWGTRHTFWRGDRVVVGRLGSRKVRDGRIEVVIVRELYTKSLCCTCS